MCVRATEPYEPVLVQRMVVVGRKLLGVDTLREGVSYIQTASTLCHLCFDLLYICDSHEAQHCEYLLEEKTPLPRCRAG